MTSRTLDGSLEKELEDLESLFADVLVSVLGEEADVVPGAEPDAVTDGAAALLAIHDESDDTYLGVHLRVSAELARRLAVRMFACAEPTREELLDAVGEFGNIAGGNLKTLLFTAARLSLPSATLDEVGLPPAREGAAAPTVLRARVLGEPAELALVPHVEAGGLAWPPSLESEVMEAQA
jgi:Chemotaxis phosphatase CheX